MPIAALGEVLPLALLWCTVGVTPLSALAVFCLGNAVGLGAGVLLAVSSRPAADAGGPAGGHVPSVHELLGFSVWIGAATIGIALLPLVVRAAASIDSYTLVAVIDVALIVFAIPQRLGTVIVLAVVPHASAIGEGPARVTLSLREHVLVTLPFALGACAVAFSPLLNLVFSALGRPLYAKSSTYLALALAAGPARVLYGLVEGVLIARGDARFLARAAIAVAVVASGVILALAGASQMTLAFAVFAAASWVSYLVALARTRRPSVPVGLGP